MNVSETILGAASVRDLCPSCETRIPTARHMRLEPGGANRTASETVGGLVNALVRAERVPAATRAVLALLCGVMASFVTYQKNVLEPTPRDLEQVWFAARSILAGVNPYLHVGPGLSLDWPHPLLYPLPAGVIAIPLAPLPIGTATLLFSALGGFALAWALMEYGYGPLLGFFSMPVRAAFEVVQWSPLLAAAATVAPLGILLVAKPTLGAAILFARPSRWAFIGAAVFGGIALLVEPRWVQHWLDAIARNNAEWAPTVPYRAPITFVGGPLVLLALLRWKAAHDLGRRPQASDMAVGVASYFRFVDPWQIDRLMKLVCTSPFAPAVTLPKSPA